MLSTKSDHSCSTKDTSPTNSSGHHHVRRERSKRNVLLARTMSTRTNLTLASFEDTEHDDLKVLKFELIRLQETVESMNSELAKAGVLEDPTAPDKKLLKKTSMAISSMVDKTLYKSFGWKGALAISASIVFLHVAFITIYTRIAVTRGCEVNVQLLDSKMWSSARSKDGHTRHICSLEMLSMRSEMFTKEGLEMLERLDLPDDTECHLNQIDHALVKEQSHRYPGYPSLLAHDFAKAEWYPCMFEGMSCDDIASMDECGPMDLLTEACEKGWITDADSKFKNPNAPERQAIGPYQCDTAPKAENASATLEYKFSHFGKCAGLVSTVFNDCPDVGNTLGAAEGLAAIISFIISTMIVAPLAIFWQYKHGDSDDPTMVADGMLQL